MRSLDRGLRLLVLLVSLTGCAWFYGAQEPKASFLAQPEMRRTLRAAADSTATDGDWPEQKWWQRFGSDELDRLVETALQASPTLKTAAHRLRQAQAQITIETARLLPGLESTAELGQARFSANSVQAKLAGESFGFILFNPANLHWHLDLWGKDRAAIAAAMGRAKARAAELAEARLWLTCAIARAYLRLARIEQSLAAAQALRDHQHGHFRVSLARWQAGLDPHMAQDLAAQRYRQAQALVEALRREGGLLRHELAFLAGQGPDFAATIEVQAVEVGRRFVLPADLPLHLLAHRPDVAAAKHLAEAAAREVKVARAAFYPDINLVGFAGLHTVSFSDILFHGSSLAYRIGPTIQLPLFEGGLLRGTLRARQAAYAEAVEKYNQVVLTAVREVADALTRWQESNRRLAAIEHALAAVRHRHRLTAGRYRAGLSDRLEVLAVAAETQLLELDRVGALSLRDQAVVDLIQALGGGWSEAARSD